MLENWIWIIIIVIMAGFAFLSLKPRLIINNSRLGKCFDDFTDVMEQNYFKYFILLIMLVAVLVRLWKFGLVPAGFNQDGAMAGIDALALAHHSTDRLGMRLPVVFTAWGSSQMYVLLSYLSIPFVALFGLNRFTARIAIVLASLVALWVIYLLCKLIFGRKVAAIVLAFCAINPWQIMQSRWALEANMFPHFFLFALYFFYLGLMKSKKFLYISMLLFGITMYSYGIAWYIIPPFLMMVSIYMLIKRRLTLKEIGLAAATYLLFAWPIFGIMIINYFKLPSLNTPFLTIPYFPDSERAADLLFFSPVFFKQLGENFLNAVNIVILQVPDWPWNNIPEYGAIYLFSIPFTLIGLLGLIGKMIHRPQNGAAATPQHSIESNTHLYMPLFCWLVIAWISGLIVSVSVNRINIIFYPMIILSGLGIAMVLRKIRLFGVIILTIYLVAFTGFCASYFGPHAKVLGGEFCDGLGEAMAYVENLDYDRIYIANSNRTQQINELYTLFYLQTDALYYQGKADAYSKDGRKLLPYNERYQYPNPEELTINPAENAVYIVNNDAVIHYDQAKFTVAKFTYFSAIVPKQMRKL